MLPCAAERSVNGFRHTQVPHAVMVEWRTPACELAESHWEYYSRLLKSWRFCHGPAEAAYRAACNELVRLVK